MIRRVTYFEKPGKENTSICIRIVSELVDEGYRHVVVATTGGETAILFGKALREKTVNLVAVTHNVGFGKPNEDDCSPEARRELETLGVKVFTGTILTRSIETAFMKKHQGLYPTYIVAETLRLFGQGTKVAVEIAMEACDAGLVPEGEDVVSVAGTGRGADTVAVIRAHPSNRFLDVRVKQILAKPL
ncbi:MAG: pyruvate kinase alpha/beta domain-containing protein [Desulfomonilaceae bacterium]|nr:pyruvate kinase alpha/beta domain-containing protein [Desulfomonilaceae bacterium]